MPTDTTLVGTPDGDSDWWKEVFTPSEATAIETRLEEVEAEELDRMFQTDPDVEPIAVGVAVDPEEFHATFARLWYLVAEMDEEYLRPVGEAFAYEYITNDDIDAEPASHEAWGFFTQLEDDDDE